MVWYSTTNYTVYSLQIFCISVVTDSDLSSKYEKNIKFIPQKAGNKERERERERNLLSEIVQNQPKKEIRKLNWILNSVIIH